ncbi:MAG: hypothetical protein WDO13_16530 [Verrucomicrobiota bacterium]
MNRSLWAVPLLGIILSLPASGQPAGNIPPPQAPFVAAPAAQSLWEIRINYPEDSAPKTPPAPGTPMPAGAAKAPLPPNRPVRIQCRRGADCTRIITTYANGAVYERYVVGTNVLTRNAASGAVTVASAEDALYAMPVFTSGYQGTAWVAADLYQGPDLINKERCYRFFRPEIVPDLTRDIVGCPALTAWIRVSNHTPAQVQIGDALYSYSAIVPDPSPIELPGDMHAAATRVRDEQGALDLLQKLNASRK